MQHVHSNSWFSERETVRVTPAGIRLAPGGILYEWQAISSATMYYTIWNGDDILGNLALSFTTGGTLHFNEFRAGIENQYLIYKGLSTYLPGFDTHCAESAAMADFKRKQLILRWLGLFSNCYWGRKPEVFRVAR